MEIKEFDSVSLKDGRVGTVCEVLGQGAAYLVDLPKPMDGEFAREHGLVTFDTEIVKHSEIESLSQGKDTLI